MPRQSAESIAAAAFRGTSSGRRHDPPAELTKEAAEVWRGIVTSRPADWFAAGNLELLALYCRLVVMSRDQAATVEACPEDDAALARMVKTATTMTTIAVKLRLTVQNNVDRKSRVLDEVDSKPKPSSLLGGHAVETRRIN